MIVDTMVGNVNIRNKYLYLIELKIQETADASLGGN